MNSFSLKGENHEKSIEVVGTKLPIRPLALAYFWLYAASRKKQSLRPSFFRGANRCDKQDATAWSYLPAGAELKVTGEIENRFAPKIIEIALLKARFQFRKLCAKD